MLHIMTAWFPTAGQSQGRPAWSRGPAGFSLAVSCGLSWSCVWQGVPSATPQKGLEAMILQQPVHGQPGSRCWRWLFKKIIIIIESHHEANTNNCWFVDGNSSYWVLERIFSLCPRKILITPRKIVTLQWRDLVDTTYILIWCRGGQISSVFLPECIIAV